MNNRPHLLISTPWCDTHGDSHVRKRDTRAYRRPTPTFQKASVLSSRIMPTFMRCTCANSWILKSRIRRRNLSGNSRAAGSPRGTSQPKRWRGWRQRRTRIANLSASSVFLTTSISSGRGQSILACDDFVADRRRNRGKGKKESSMDFSATTEIRRRRRATSFIIDAWQNLIFHSVTQREFSRLSAGRWWHFERWRISRSWRQNCRLRWISSIDFQPSGTTLVPRI